MHVFPCGTPEHVGDLGLKEWERKDDLSKRSKNTNINTHFLAIDQIIFNILARIGDLSSCFLSLSMSNCY